MTAEPFDNSSLALDRIRALTEALPADGDRKLPTERTLADMLGISRRAGRWRFWKWRVWSGGGRDRAPLPGPGPILRPTAWSRPATALISSR